MVSKVFDGLIRKILEAYIDHMVVNGRDFGDHLESLKIVFERFRKYRIKLNSKKCMCAVTSSMFLGHIMGKIGIKALPMQLQDILKLIEARAKKDIKMLTRRVVALSHFISRMIDRCKSFFQALCRKQTRFGEGSNQRNLGS